MATTKPQTARKPSDPSKPKKPQAPRLERNSARKGAIIQTMRAAGGTMSLGALLESLKTHEAFTVIIGGEPTPDPLLSKTRLQHYFKALQKLTDKAYKDKLITDEQYGNFPKLVSGRGASAMDISELANLLS